MGFRSCPIAVVVVVIVCLLSAFSLAQDESLVTIHQGTMRGIVEDDVRVFLGVPFAQPPINDLRWRSPKEPSKFSEEIYDATSKKDDCVQPDQERRMSEDCLYLNLYAPRTSSPNFGNFSVLVFWYGGSFGSGGITKVPVYNGKGIVEYTKDHIVVFSNYRVSALGFLGSDELAAESEDGSTGNYGLQDQRMSLVWVKNNIEFFGGNPNSVLIFGESAGSWSVQNHLVMPKSAPYFSKAIMESGVNNGMFIMDRTQYNAQWEKFSGQMGCNRDPQCMRNFTYQELLEGTDRWWSFGDWGLRIDGVEVKEDPRILIQQGQFSRVPVIIGYNREEVPGDLDQWTMTEEEYDVFLNQEFDNKYGRSFVDQMKTIYTVGENGKYEKPWYAIQAIRSHEIFTCAARRNVRWMSQYSDVYFYEFQKANGLIEALVPMVGAFHASELVYTLRFRPLLLTLEDRRVSKSVVDYWTNFADTGNPNGEPETWEKFVLGSNEGFLQIDATESMAFNAYKIECDLWDTVQHINPKYHLDVEKNLEQLISLKENEVKSNK